MSILTTEDLGLSFGDFDLFQGISVRVANDSKIGLIGPNGIGKTSLLLILAGLNQPTTGRVHIARGRRLGYLRQEAVEAFAARDNTVYAEMTTLFAHLEAEQERLHAMEAEMAAGRFTDALLDQYGSAQQAFELAGGYDYELRIQQTLTGLGLGQAFWNMPLYQLSGGQQTRALLAKLLLQKPDLLILDEPTNHLDTEALDWLERTLRDWEGAVLIVSHDRYFLDNVVNTIWEMSRLGVEIYAGNYSAYLLQRQERWERYQQVFAEEKARLEKEWDFIQRNIVRASSNARAVGMLRRLSRELAVVQAYGIGALQGIKSWHETGFSNDRPMGVDEAGRIIRSLKPPSGRPPQLNLNLNLVHSSGNIVLRAHHLRAGYKGGPLPGNGSHDSSLPGNELASDNSRDDGKGRKAGRGNGAAAKASQGKDLQGNILHGKILPDNLLFTIDELELKRGERAALIGPNGSGKTTFLKTLLGQVAPLGGQLHLGASLRIGYLAQAHAAMNPENSVLDELLQHKEMPAGKARSHLAHYLFRGEDVFKPVSALSGGERSRLALAILALQGANFLLLDEPTNHLDIPAQEALQEVLEHFPGTILLVSHDRYLVDQLATQIWELHDGQMQVFKGTYREFVLARASATAQNRQLILPSRPQVRDNSKATRQLQQALDRIEARIREQERAVQRLNRELQAAGKAQAFERMHQLSWKYAQAQAELEQLTADWEKMVQ